jgi:hypothetical protein
MSPQRIRVCFVAPKAYPLFNSDAEGVIGGAEVDLYYLATELARDEGFAVSFLVADYGQPPREQRQNVELIKGVNFREPQLYSAWRIWRTLGRIDPQVVLLATSIAQAFLPTTRAGVCFSYGKQYGLRRDLFARASAFGTALRSLIAQGASDSDAKPA